VFSALCVACRVLCVGYVVAYALRPLTCSFPSLTRIFSLVVRQRRTSQEDLSSSARETDLQRNTGSGCCFAVSSVSELGALGCQGLFSCNAVCHSATKRERVCVCVRVRVGDFVVVKSGLLPFWYAFRFLPTLLSFPSLFRTHTLFVPHRVKMCL
jgi:hypothetical protein